MDAGMVGSQWRSSRNLSVSYEQGEILSIHWCRDKMDIGMKMCVQCYSVLVIGLKVKMGHFSGNIIRVIVSDLIQMLANKRKSKWRIRGNLCIVSHELLLTSGWKFHFPGSIQYFLVYDRATRMYCYDIAVEHARFKSLSEVTLWIINYVS